MKSFWLGVLLGAGVVYYVASWFVQALLAFFAEGVIRESIARRQP